jgi:cell shape-determining protein MreC
MNTPFIIDILVVIALILSIIALSLIIILLIRSFIVFRKFEEIIATLARGAEILASFQEFPVRIGHLIFEKIASFLQSDASNRESSERK